MPSLGEVDGAHEDLPGSGGSALARYHTRPAVQSHLTF